METTNLSKIRREKMLHTIKEIKKNIVDEETLNNLSLIENELTKKKYGLIWEEHEERVDKELETQIPTFEEVKGKQIKTCNDKFNFLLEGDNLHSLYLLEKTHRGRIDVIYIDPPYNTGNKDFTYNDKYIDDVDEFKHSKWLSFMSKRLNIAYKLLNDTGVIFISIDNNELSQLKMLCDDIFGESNFVCNICRQAIKGGSRANNIKTVNDYVLIYAKNIAKMKSFTGYDKEEQKLNLEDEKGLYRRGRELNKWGAGSRREDSPSMWFPIPGPNGEDVYPIRNDGSDGRWRWGKTKLLKAVKENDVIFEKRANGTYIVYEKERGNKNTKSQFTSWFSDNYINAKGSESLKKIFNTMMSVFDYAKPVELIHDLVFMANCPNGIVLDFFAGSGTTAQAVLELNKEDGGNRQFILCTNNENNICENITYKRIDSVINGYTNVDGINANLKYYKTSYVPRINTDEENLSKNLMVNIKNLIQLENGIEIDDKIVRVILTEEEIDKFTTNDKELDECEKLYISSDILLTSKQSKIFNDYNIELFIIPEYYFEEEIREVA